MAGNSSWDVSNDTIFITGLPEDTTEDELKDYFGQIGIIKFDKKNSCPKIWIYKDKTTGKGKGEATLTYDDPPTAGSAISWFNDKEFRGSKLKIELAQRRGVPQFTRGGGRGGRGSFGGGRGGGGYDRGDRAGPERGYRDDRGPREDWALRDDRGGGGGGSRDDRSSRDDRGGPRNDWQPREDRGMRDDRGGRPSAGQGRPGDWLCPSCNNNNFAYRQECNRCRTKKPASAGGGGESGGDSNIGSMRRVYSRERARSYRDRLVLDRR